MKARRNIASVEDDNEVDGNKNLKPECKDVETQTQSNEFRFGL